MYLKLIILLVGLKLCHTTNETSTASVEDDNKLFDLLRVKGKNYKEDISVLTKVYQNDSDNVWNQFLARLHSSNVTKNNGTFLEEMFQNDSPNDANEELDTNKIHSDNNQIYNEDVNDDLKNLLSLVDSKEVLNDAPVLSKENHDYDTDESSDESDNYPPYDEWNMPDNFGQVVEPVETNILNVPKNEYNMSAESSEESDSYPPYDEWNMPDNFGQVVEPEATNNVPKNVSNLEKVSTTTENDQPIKLITTEKTVTSEQQNVTTNENNGSQIFDDDNLPKVSTTTGNDQSIKLESTMTEKNLKQTDVTTNANNVSQIFYDDILVEVSTTTENDHPFKLELIVTEKFITEEKHVTRNANLDEKLDSTNSKQIETVSSGNKDVETNANSNDKVNLPNIEELETASPEQKNVTTNANSDEKVDSSNNEDIETASSEQKNVTANANLDEKVDSSSSDANSAQKNVSTNTNSGEKIDSQKNVTIKANSNEKINLSNSEEVETTISEQKNETTNENSDEKVDSSNTEDLETASSEQKQVTINANNVSQIVNLDDILNKTIDLKNKFPNLYRKHGNNQRSLAFVFDSTGSMWDDLEQLKGGAEKIMSAMEERDDNPIYNYILVPFHDPKVGPITVTNDKELFRHKLDELDVYGGGDCPEMSLGGISMAIDASLPRSYVYVLTDATAADHLLVGCILDKVLQKQIQVVFVLTGDCNNRTSPEYTVYEKIAAASSGQVFHLKKSDVNQVLDFVRKTLDSRRENLLVVTNVSPTNKSPHKVAIDSSLDQFTISVSGTNPKIDVVNPQGEHINEPPKVEQILDLENIQVINVNNPSNGSWEIKVSSGSDHSIRLSGLTDLRIDHGFSVYVPKNMDETNHRPLHGQNTYLLLKPSNGTIVDQITSVDLIGLDGQPLRHNIDMSLLPGTNDTYISEKFRPPNSFFNLFIKGEDKNGNPFIRLTSTAIKSQFPEKPFVTVTEQEVYHLVHVPLNISCHVETLVPAKVQWFKNGKAVSDRLTKKTTGWIHWSDMFPDIHTAGMYTCRAQNEAGTNEENILLHMMKRPILKKPYKLSESLKPGSAFSADCYALSGIPSPGIEWMKNERIITSDSGINIHFNGTLHIPYVTTDHEGLYQCVAANSAGVDTYNLDIRVEVAPSFAVENDNGATIEEYVDKTLELHCQAIGVPKPFITWLKDGIKLNQNDDFQLFDENTTLVIPKIALDHEGVFTCVAFNRIGSVNKSISLSVIVPLAIQSPLTDDEIIAIEGNEVHLPCLVFGKPKPTVSWKINSSTYEVISENTNLSFTANRNSSGRYECIAENLYDKVGRVWYLDVFTRPIIEPSLDETIEIRENETIELVCQATGHPKPFLNWISNKIFDQIVENETLTILGKRDQTSVNYTCIAENTAGVTAKTFTIIVKAPPKLLTNHSNNIQILENETLLMPCKADGNPNPDIKWYKNDQALNNGSIFVINIDNSLSIPSIVRNLTGIYKCEATNSEGVDFLVNNVTVLVPPEVANSINNNVEVIEGKSVQIECPITDSFPPPTVQWFKNGNNVENTLVPKNHTQNNLLFIQTTTISDDGIYICIATNIAGSAEAQVYLTVLYQPKIKNKQNTPIRIKKHTGDLVQLNCEADGNPKPKTQWLRNNTVIAKDNSTLSIENLKLKDRDNYTCQASNRIGNDESVYFLDVLEPPKIQGPDYEQIDVIRGQTTIIMCQVTGFPQPEIIWSKSSTDMPLDQLGIEIVDNNLKILSMDYQHQGSYKCEAINTEGVSTKSVNIKIKVEPTITVTPKNKTIIVKENDKFILECIVEGIPKPELHWDKNGDELTIENFQREFTARSSPIESHLTRYTLIARNVTASLSGHYHCNASNSLGPSSSEFNVTVLTSPKLKLGTNSQNNSIEAIENSHGVFVCNIDVGNPPAKITWFKNNKILSEDLDNKIKLESNKTILKIFDVNIMDSGMYNCSASNPIGEIGQSFKFDVLVSPKTDSESQVPIDVVLGDDLRLYCDISGHPKPSIMWLKESSPIEKVYSTGQLLILKNASTSENGEYTCVALNKAGTSKMSFNVKILEPPKFLDNSPAELNINTSIKHGFVLRCDIGGSPSPNITWEKEGRPLLNRLNNTAYHISSDQTYLQISNPKISDAGKYLCEAQNSVGMLRRQFNVFLKVMAKWNSWSEWSECSVTCGEGIRTRVRLCNYPEQFENNTIAIDLSGCMGPNTESQNCIQSPCAIDGGWSDWTDWTSCSATCGSGVQHRYRYCNNPSPAYGGANCSGPNIEETVCNDRPCPKDGDWSTWSDWSSCSTTCGNGVRYRSRECDSPKPEYGGKDCAGNYVETIECIQEPCPVNGGWSDWEPWSPCSTTCGLGRKVRKRHCTNPVPQYGGRKCKGDALMITGCTAICFDEDHPKPIKYNIAGNINGIPVLSHSIWAETYLDGSTKTYKFKSFEDKDSWRPSLVFLVAPMPTNMLVLEQEDQSEEIDDVYGDDFDENEFEQESKVSFQTGQEVLIRQEGKIHPENGIMEVFIQMDGELPIVQSESKVVIDPYTENSIPTSKTTRQTSANNYITIDGKPIQYSWNSKIKYKNRPQLRKLMVEKISAENIAANFDPRKKELNLVMTTNVEDGLDCPTGFETDRSQNICVDINECAKNLCHSSQICTNTVGSYKCSCRDGYKSLGNGYRCLDINECIMDIHECSHYCENVPGEYRCSCPNGMILGGDRHTCSKIKKKKKMNLNNDGFIHPRNFMDELNDHPNNYSNELDYPVSDYGFFNTSEECPTGFYPENNECLDINECLDDPKICSNAHTCLNTKGSYLCLPAPCPEYANRDIRTSSCIQYCNDTNNAEICSENAEITQTLAYKTLSIMEKDIVPGDPLMELDMETFGTRSKYVSYFLQDSTSDLFEVYSTRRGFGILTCYGFPEKSRVHRLIAIGNAYKNAKKTKLLSTTKYIIHVYVFD